MSQDIELVSLPESDGRRFEGRLRDSEEDLVGEDDFEDQDLIDNDDDADEDDDLVTAHAEEFRSSTGRTREEWRRDSRSRRRRKRRIRRKIAKRNMYLWTAVGFLMLTAFVTLIVLLYKSTSSAQHTPSTSALSPSTAPALSLSSHSR